jgi:hypothetical protein
MNKYIKTLNLNSYSIDKFYESFTFENVIKKGKMKINKEFRDNIK